jgi:hypothetical protein
MSPESQKVVSASDEHFAEPPIPAGVTIGAGRPAERRRARPHSRKFRAATVALLGIAVGALAAAIGIAASSSPRVRQAGVAWSSWRPPDGGLQGAQEIADYLAPYYRATSSDQLAVVTVVNLNNTANPIQVVIPSSGSTGSLIPLPASSTVVYDLCGEGSDNCAIGVGRPSPQRLLLLKREALELALYTFKYIGGTQTVVAVLPPGHTIVGCTGICAKPQAKPVVKPLNLAVAFDRQELSPYLAQPLRSTLPEELPPSVSQIATAPEATLVSVIAAHGLFSESTAHGQDGSTVMSMSPLPPQ